MGLEDQLTKEDIQQTNKQKNLTLLVTRRYHHITIKIAVQKFI